MKVVQVSEETYGKLQKLARPFEDSPEDVIRWLLAECGDGARPPTKATSGLETSARLKSAPASVGKDLLSQGGRIPHGTKLQSIYKGKEYLAEVRDGAVVWNGRHYSSLSAAAVAVIQSTGSDRPTEDGWRFWEFWDERKKQWVSKADPKDRSW